MKTYLKKLYLQKYKPKVVVVASDQSADTAAAVSAVLAAKYKVQNEMPSSLIAEAKSLLFTDQPPEWIVLDGKKHDSHFLASIKPTISIAEGRVRANEKTLSFGIDIERADLKASYESKLPSAITFKVAYKGNSFPIVIEGTTDLSLVAPVLAALAVGLHENINIVAMSEALRSYKLLKL